jgi:hypothetical protein
MRVTAYAFRYGGILILLLHTPYIEEEMITHETIERRSVYGEEVTHVSLYRVTLRTFI